MKNELISPRILQYLNSQKPFILKVDASSLGCAGVLLQEKNGINMPISYISKSFVKGELNKAIIEKELLAIYHSINQFRPYLYNTKFTVYTDHKPLIYLYGMKNPTSKLVRIKIELDEYDFDILHIRGKENTQADVSILKLDSLKKNINLNEDEPIEINGEVKKPISSLGTAMINLFVGNFIITKKRAYNAQ